MSNMRKIRLVAEIGFAGCGDEQFIEVDETVTDKELTRMANEFAMEHASSWEGDDRLGFDIENEDDVEAFWEGVEGWWEEVEDDS